MPPVIILLFLATETVAASQLVQIPYEHVTLHMNQVLSMAFNITNSTDFSDVTVTSNSDTSIATVYADSLEKVDGVWYGNLNITGVFLGNTKVSFSVVRNGLITDINDALTVTVIRQDRLIDTIFTASVAILVSILYVNFGCAMDWNVCRNTVKRPIGPLIGFFCQFVFMPLLSFGIGYLLFPEHPELQIGMFFTGISPSGGASNIWTVLLEGNLNLSVTMTTMCTIAAFGVMPFWIFTLGRYIFERGDIVIPYSRISTFAVSLILPLAIGFLIQRKFPKFSRMLVRIMKPFSIVLILFIIVFAIFTNLYLFKLFSMQIIIAGMGLPWLGFIFGLAVSFICKQSWADVKAIAIETGMQNTGVAIFLLRFTLPAPAADLTTVVPVASAIMTPIPLMILYLGKLIYTQRKESSARNEPSLEKLHAATEISTVSRPSQN